MGLRSKRLILALGALVGVGIWLLVNPESYETIFVQSGDADLDYAATAVTEIDPDAPLATEILERLEVKGRAPKTGYTREEFYNGWPTVEGCSLRQRIIKRANLPSKILGVYSVCPACCMHYPFWCPWIGKNDSNNADTSFDVYRFPCRM